jgi:hypothetical protein
MVGERSFQSEPETDLISNTKRLLLGRITCPGVDA